MQYEFLLKQHIGSKSVAIVKSGDKVKRGSLIAKKSENTLGANLFSSINGIIVSVDENKITIKKTETDFNSYEKLTGSTLKELILESGMIGLGGAGFPTYEKLNTQLSPRGTVIINAVECEPILSHNISRIEKEPENLVRALDIITEFMNVEKAIIAIKNTHTEEIIKLKNTLKDSNYKIRELENIYPMGEERAIIREVLGTLLPIDSLPNEADTVVLNLETALRIREAVEDKKPFIDKDITVAGKLRENASIHVIFDVPLGKPIKRVFEEAGGISEEYGEIIMGGPFTGKRVSINDHVIKTTGGLIATENFFKESSKMGILVCACGGDKERLEEIAASMGSDVIGIEYCKQAKPKGNGLKCENPGRCPGQVEKIIKFKKNGAKAVLMSNCTDCSNTVMSCAPNLGMKVYHCTDGAMRAVNYKLIRRYKI